MSESVQTISVSKINNMHTYTPVLNYWAPLAYMLVDEDDDTEKEFAASVYENKTTQEQSIIIDSGATSHFVTTTTNLPKTGHSNKTVLLPDGNKLRATHKVHLPFDNLEKQAQEADVLPNLKKSLMSVGQLADQGYTTIFHPKDQGVTVHNTVDITASTPVLQGCRSKSGLWKIKLTDKAKVSAPQKQTTCEANNVYTLPAVKQSIRYLHAAAGYPTKETWIAAVKAGNFSSWPGLTEQAIKRHFPESNETQCGHLKKQRQHVRSTKQTHPNQRIKNTPHTEPTPEHGVIHVVIFNSNNTVYTDQTGKFPITSNRGNKYIMIMYEVGSNCIDAEPFKNRSENELVKTYEILYERLTRTNKVAPKLHILDNEAPTILKKIIKQRCTMQLVPPDTHRRNLAERAIQTFKAHFLRTNISQWRYGTDSSRRLYLP